MGASLIRLDNLYHSNQIFGSKTLKASSDIEEICVFLVIISERLVLLISSITSSGNAS